MVTLPAFLQGVENPVPRVGHPEWILRRKREQDDKYKQADLRSMMEKMGGKKVTNMLDIEDLGDRILGESTNPKPKKGKRADIRSFARQGKKRGRDEDEEEEDMAEDDIEKEKQQLGPQPDQEKDYHAWLAWQKARWAIQKKERKRFVEKGHF